MIHTHRILPLGLGFSVSSGPPPWNIYADRASAFWWSAVGYTDQHGRTPSDVASMSTTTSTCRLASEFL